MPFDSLTRAASRIAFAASIWLVAIAARAEDWPHWRGDSRNSHSREASGLRDAKWIDPQPVWTANAGEGSTSPIVAAGRLYVLGWKDGRDRLQCLDAATGKRLWSTDYPAPRHARFATGDEGLYAGPTATPEFDPATGSLYTLGSDGELVCWDTQQDGKQVWRLNVYDRFHAPQRPKVKRSGLRDYGYTASQVVYRDWLLVETGSPEGTLAALEKGTGKPVWQSEYNQPAGHSGAPVLMTVEGAPCLAVFTLRHLVVVRLDAGREGKTIATYDWETEFANNLLTPTVLDGDVLISSYHTHHAICRLRITLGGAEKVWQQPFASHVGSPVIHDGCVYLCGKELVCLDWDSGAPRWKGGRFDDGGSCLVTADDRLVILGSKGVLCLVDTAKRSPDRYHAVAQHERLLASDAWPHVVLADGRIYIKDRQGALKCLAVK